MSLASTNSSDPLVSSSWLCTAPTVVFQTNGTNNGSQAKLNLKAGSNVTIVDDGAGGITISSTGGSGGTLTASSVQSALAQSTSDTCIAWTSGAGGTTGQQSFYYTPTGIYQTAPGAALCTGGSPLPTGSTASFGTLTGAPTDNSALATALNGKQAALGYTAENTANKGAANGYAPLGSDGKVPSANLPTATAPASSFAGLTGQPTDNTNLATALSGKQASLGFTPENSANKGAVNGYAPLDGSGKVPAANVPASSFGSLTGAPNDNSALAAALNGKAASNASTTVNGQTCALGGSCTVSTGSSASPATTSQSGTVTLAPGATAVVSKAGSTGSAYDLVGSEPQGRTVYERGYWTNLNDFTYDSINMAAAVDSNGKITVSGGGSNLTSWFEVNNSLSSDDEVDFEVNLRINTLGTGFSVGKISQNTTYGNLNNSFVGWMDTSDSPNKLLFLVGNGQSFAGYGNQVVLPANLAAGDFIHMVYSQRETKISIFVEDYTSGAKYTNSYTLPLGVSYTPASPNMSKLALWVQGGNYTIQSMRITSLQPQKPYIAAVGDSKTWGYGQSFVAQRYPNHLKSLGSVAVYAGQGDGTTEVLSSVPYICATHPQYVLLNIGRNDLANGVPSSTWQSNYTQIDAGFKNCGATVVHLLPFPETNSQGTQSALKSWIQSTFSTEPMIDPSVNFNTSTMVASDTTHLSDAGAAFAAGTILNSGIIPVSPNPSGYEPIPSASRFPITTAVAPGTTATYNSTLVTGNYTSSLVDDVIFTNCSSACTITLSDLRSVQKDVIVSVVAGSFSPTVASYNTWFHGAGGTTYSIPSGQAMTFFSYSDTGNLGGSTDYNVVSSYTPQQSVAQANYLQCKATCTPDLSQNETTVFITANNVSVTLPSVPLNSAGQNNVGPTYTVTVECFQDTTGCGVLAPQGGSIVGYSAGYPLSALGSVTLASYAVTGVGTNWIIVGSH